MSRQAVFRLASLFAIVSMMAIGGWVSRAAACDEGFEAFQQTVYAKVRQDCVKCHNGQKPTAPPFALPDPMRSYEQLVSYMNFSKPEESLLVIRAGNGHCGDEACESDSGKAMLELAKQWWTRGEKSCERNGHYFSAEMPLPSALPKAKDGFTTMTFDLGVARPELQGISFQVEVQNYLDAVDKVKGAYRFRSPRLIGGQRSLLVKDVKILLNGKYDVVYNQYSTVNRTVAFFPVNDTAAKTATTVLSGEAIIMLKDSLDNPQISVSFVDIGEKIDAPTCGNAEIFSNQVMPLLVKNNCVNCHSAAGKSIGEKIFDCSLPADRLCMVSRQLIDPDYTMVSPLITYPSQGIFNHPQLSDHDRYDYVKAIKSWLAQ